jgi:putative transposase
LGQIFHQIAQDYGFKIIAYEVMPDHIHLLVEARPKYSPAQTVQYFKGISSKLMRQEFLEEIERFIWKENTLWARGYYVASLADSITTEVIREYINNQKTCEVEPRKAPESSCHQLNLL